MMFGLGRPAASLVGPDEALPGRSEPCAVSGVHFVHGRPILPPWPDGS
jgi:peptide-methionine (S)-S-oxide reductase